MALPSITEIEHGNSILFLGAGFSAAAINLNKVQIKSVDLLIKQLLADCGISDPADYDLETASEEYVNQFGEEAAIRLLHNNFRSNIINDNQKIVVCQPWYPIYTTNYDDIVECVCTIEHKAYTTKETNDPVEPPLPDTTQLLHIYGNITRSSASEFRNRFLLTENQRDNNPFMSSSWFRRFYDDLLSASSIVFVGFSLRDIDIRRLLGRMPNSVLAKFHFVNSVDSPKSPSKNFMKDYRVFVA